MCGHILLSGEKMQPMTFHMMLFYGGKSRFEHILPRETLDFHTGKPVLQTDCGAQDTSVQWNKL